MSADLSSFCYALGTFNLHLQSSNGSSQGLGLQNGWRSLGKCKTPLNMAQDLLHTWLLHVIDFPHLSLPRLSLWSCTWACDAWWKIRLLCFEAMLKRACMHLSMVPQFWKLWSLSQVHARACCAALKRGSKMLRSFFSSLGFSYHQYKGPKWVRMLKKICKIH